MVLLPRDPRAQNVTCKHDENSGTAEAGAVVYLSGDSKVAKVATSGNVPYAMLGIQVKANAAGLPQNFEFPGELGTTVQRLGDPVLLYNGGLFDTTHYDLVSCAAGDPLYAKLGEGKLTNVASGVAAGHDGNPMIVAEAQHALSAGQVAAENHLRVKLVL